jgi:uncharacterized repeat protein (TIGR02543 family)
MTEKGVPVTLNGITYDKYPLTPQGNGTYIQIVIWGGYVFNIPMHGNSMMDALNLTAPNRYSVDYLRGDFGTFNEVRVSGLIGGTQSIPSPPNPVTGQAGYIFTGWFDELNNVFYGPNDSLPTGTITKSYRFVAQWSAGDQPLVYNGNGATAGTMGNEIHVTNSKFNLTANAYSKAGYSFLGWATTVAGTVVYQDESLFTMPAGGATVYAVWAENDGYTVKYDTNGGDPATIADLENVLWTQDGLLPNTLTKAGYRLAGWNVIEGGVKEGVTSSDKYSELANNDQTMSITLQAQWEEDPSQWVTVTFVSSDIT